MALAVSGHDADTAAHEWGSAPEFVGPRHEYRESLMRRRLLATRPGRRILNAGCGAGSMTLDLLGRGYEVTSVDASPAFVEHVRMRIDERFASLRPLPAVEVGDLHALRFADASFDAVVCGEVLEHLEDDEAAAREIARVLTPGGVLVASVPANPHRYDWVDGWAGHRRRYTVEALEGVLAGAGLVDVEVTPWGFPLTGIYHRRVYRPLLRRRLARRGGAGPPTAPPGFAGRAAHRMVRLALEIDTLFVGRAPGWYGLIALARSPGPSG
jgi:SAM-dependent methyltransferase